MTAPQAYDGRLAPHERLGDLYATMWQAVVDGVAGTGIVAGCGMGPTSPASDQRSLASGAVQIRGGASIAVDPQLSDHLMWDPVFPVFVLYEIDSAGVLHTRRGDPHPKCLIPAGTAGRVLRGVDLLLPGHSTVSGDLSLDLGKFVPPTVAVPALVSGVQSSPVAIAADGLHAYDLPLPGNLSLVVGAPTLRSDAFLHIVLRGTGAASNVTVSATGHPLLWQNGTPPVPDTTNGAVTEIMLRFDGTEWLGSWAGYQ